MNRQTALEQMRAFPGRVVVSESLGREYRYSVELGRYDFRHVNWAADAWAHDQLNTITEKACADYKWKSEYLTAEEAESYLKADPSNVVREVGTDYIYRAKGNGFEIMRDAPGYIWVPVSGGRLYERYQYEPYPAHSEPEKSEPEEWEEVDPKDASHVQIGGERFEVSFGNGFLRVGPHCFHDLSLVDSFNAKFVRRVERGPVVVEICIKPRISAVNVVQIPREIDGSKPYKVRFEQGEK